MPSLRKYRQNSVCCMSLKTGCALLAILELFYAPIYIFSNNLDILDAPEYLIAIFGVQLIASLTLLSSTCKRCYIRPCHLIITIILRIVLNIVIICAAIYLLVIAIGEGDVHAIILHIIVILVTLGLGSYIWLCALSFYLQLTESPEPSSQQQILNVAITIG